MGKRFSPKTELEMLIDQERAPLDLSQLEKPVDGLNPVEPSYSNYVKANPRDISLGIDKDMTSVAEPQEAGSMSGAEAGAMAAAHLIKGVGTAIVQKDMNLQKAQAKKASGLAQGQQSAYELQSQGQVSPLRELISSYKKALS